MDGWEPVHAVVALVQWLCLRCCMVEMLADVWVRAAGSNVDRMLIQCWSSVEEMVVCLLDAGVSYVDCNAVATEILSAVSSYK